MLHKLTGYWPDAEIVLHQWDTDVVETYFRYKIFIYVQTIDI